MSRNTTSVMGGVASATISSGNYCNITPTDQVFFFNSIMRVSFWAQKVSGTPYVELFSSYLTAAGAVTVPITSTNWQQYTIDMPTQGLDTPPQLFLRVDGTSGVMNIQKIDFQATPIGTASTTGTGTSSSVVASQYFDGITIGSGANTVYRCTTAGTLPVGAMTVTASDCDASVATTLTIN